MFVLISLLNDCLGERKGEIGVQIFCWECVIIFVYYLNIIFMVCI